MPVAGKIVDKILAPLVEDIELSIGHIEYSRFNGFDFESPIEEIMAIALAATTLRRHAQCSEFEFEPNAKDWTIERFFKEHYLDKPVVDNQHDQEETLYVVPQFQIENWRVDFLVSYLYFAEKSFIKIIVECDGHDFHERTKEQAERDRSRDRWAQANGFKVFRFTGREIYRDPMACACEVMQWEY